MKKWLSISLFLAILALFLVGCVGASRSSGGFTSDEQHDLNWYQLYGP